MIWLLIIGAVLVLAQIAYTVWYLRKGDKTDDSDDYRGGLGS